MEERKPIKRSIELRSLSKDHHDGLLLCWKINTGVNKMVPSDRISSYILFFFDSSLDVHFEEEETHMFSLLGPDNSYRKEAEMQHKLLREMVAGFRNKKITDTESLKDFAALLNKHIRYEERVLFNIIEEERDRGAIRITVEKFTSHIKCNTEWHDQFWLP